MAYTLCEKPIKHEGNSVDMTSPHLKEDMRNNILHDPNDIHRLSVIALQRGSLILDNAFLEECGLTGIAEITFDPYNENHAKLYETIKPVCSICFREYLQKIGIER